MSNAGGLDLPVQPTISVVLPARNEAASIREAISSIQSQTYPGHLIEILVIDGGSRDRTREIVRDLADQDARIHLIDNPTGLTPSALNIGVRAATGEVIARMDGHSQADDRYLELAMSALRATGAWSVGGQMRKVGTTPQERANAVAASSPVGVGDAEHNYSTKPQLVETVFLGTWPRRVFDLVGFFDEELVRNQDDEHAYRIRRAGGRIWYDPRMIVYYRPRPTVAALFDQYRQYGYWKVRVFQKDAGAARPRHLVPAAWVTVIALLGSLSVISSRSRQLLATLAAMYLAVLAIEAERRQREADPWRTVLALAALHAGYGVGFLQGIKRFGSPFRRGAAKATHPKP